MAIVLAVIAPSSTQAQRIEGIYGHRFAEYIHWLDLDEDQTEVAWAMHRDYERAYDEEFLPVIRDYTAKMPAIHEPGYNEARKAHADERRAIDEEMKRRDEEFFARLQSLLRPEQVERMERVRYARHRQILRTHRGELPEGNVDLAAFLPRLELSDQEEEGAFDVLDRYEPQLITALQESWKAWRRFFPLSHEVAALQAEVNERQARGDGVETAVLKRELDLLKDRWARTTKATTRRLVELNRATLAQFLEVLDDQSASELKRLYNEEAYPEVYPDPMNAIVLYGAAAEIDTLSEGQAASVAAAREQFEREHHRMSRTLAEAFMERRKGNLAWEVIFDPGLKREALNARQIEVLRAILLPEQIALLPEWDFEESPPERPWDWGDMLSRWERYRKQDERLDETRDERIRGGRRKR